MISICFHGAESTGKSTLAAALSAEFGVPWVAEYGREWAETRGTDFSMADLLAIAAGQDRAMRQAAATNPPLLLLDTDPLMTAAWAAMLFGTVPQELMAYPKATHYLLFDVDTEWVEDGTRFFGESGERALFEALSEEMLIRAGVTYERISGNWDEREAAVRAAISRAVP